MKTHQQICLFILAYMAMSAIAGDVNGVMAYSENENVGPCSLSKNVITDEEHEISGWSVFVDQDLFVVNPKNPISYDHNYTMGFGVSYSGSRNKEGVIASGRDWIDGQLLIHDDEFFSAIESMHTTSYGLSAYTPDDLENKLIIQGDRPYASLVYISNTKMKAYLNGESTETTLVVGVLGSNIAKETQRYIHNELKASREDPLGWDNQISDGGELTALYSIENKKLISSCYSTNKTSSDISYTVLGDIGYIIDGAVGVDFRWGYIGTPYYLHTTTPVSNYNHYNCYGCLIRDNYIFLSLKLRVTAYNALLQGQFRDSALTIDKQDLHRVTYETSLGWAYSLNPEWKMTYSINYKSKEYEESGGGGQWYGGLYLSKRFIE